MQRASKGYFSGASCVATTWLVLFALLLFGGAVFYRYLGHAPTDISALSRQH